MAIVVWGFSRTATFENSKLGVEACFDTLSRMPLLVQAKHISKPNISFCTKSGWENLSHSYSPTLFPTVLILGLGPLELENVGHSTWHLVHQALKPFRADRGPRTEDLALECRLRLELTPTFVH